MAALPPLACRWSLPSLWRASWTGPPCSRATGVCWLAYPLMALSQQLLPIATEQQWQSLPNLTPPLLVLRRELWLDAARRAFTSLTGCENSNLKLDKVLQVSFIDRVCVSVLC